MDGRAVGWSGPPTLTVRLNPSRLGGFGSLGGGGIATGTFWTGMSGSCLVGAAGRAAGGGGGSGAGMAAKIVS